MLKGGAVSQYDNKVQRERERYLKEQKAVRAEKLGKMRKTESSEASAALYQLHQF